jgi:mRNA interferase YafQ
MLKPKPTAIFKRDKKRMKTLDYNMDELMDVTHMIMDEIPLPPEYDEHPLHGNYAGMLECHLEDDWLLIYKINDEKRTVVFHRTGSHSDLFS